MKGVIQTLRDDEFQRMLKNYNQLTNLAEYDGDINQELLHLRLFYATRDEEFMRKHGNLPIDEFRKRVQEYKLTPSMIESYEVRDVPGPGRVPRIPEWLKERLKNDFGFLEERYDVKITQIDDMGFIYGETDMFTFFVMEPYRTPSRLNGPQLHFKYKRRIKFSEDREMLIRYVPLISSPEQKEMVKIWEEILPDIVRELDEIGFSTKIIRERILKGTGLEKSINDFVIRKRVKEGRSREEVIEIVERADREYEEIIKSRNYGMGIVYFNKGMTQIVYDVCVPSTKTENLDIPKLEISVLGDILNEDVEKALDIIYKSIKERVLTKQ